MAATKTYTAELAAIALLSVCLGREGRRRDMLARVPYGIPTWELLLSMGLLIITTIGTIYGAAKIYRTGLLMYGKKVNLKELIKWLRYKN